MHMHRHYTSKVYMFKSLEEATLRHLSPALQASLKSLAFSSLIRKFTLLGHRLAIRSKNYSVSASASESLFRDDRALSRLLDDPLLRRLVQGMQGRLFPDGCAVCTRGDVLDRIFIVTSGE